MKIIRLFPVLAILLLGGCTLFSQSSLPTSYPEDYVPTMVAMTMQAGLPEPTDTSTAVGLTGPSPTRTPPLGKTRTQQPTNAPLLTPAAPSTSLISVSITAPPTQTATRGVKITLTPTAPPTRTPRTPTSTATRRPTRTPTITPTPAIPEASVQIYSPGPMSKITSPLSYHISLKPGSSGRVRIELLGEDGRLLVRKLISYSANSGLRIYLTGELDFEIPGVAEAARLQISTDDQYGRMVALGSVNLVLLSVGEADINPSGDLMEDIFIREPIVNTLIQGGTLTVAGVARPNGNGLLLVKLTDALGRVLGYSQAAIGVLDSHGFGQFVVDVPYTAKSPTWVRLSISEDSDRIPGNVHVSSIEVLLSP